MLVTFEQCIMSVFQFILQFSEVCLWVHQLYDVGTYLPFQLFPRGFFFSAEMRNIIRSRQRNLSQIVLIELTANEKEKRERRRWKDEAEEAKLSKGVVKTDTLFTRCTYLYCNKHSARLCNISNTSRGRQRVERGSRVGGGGVRSQEVGTSQVAHFTGVAEGRKE